MHRGSLLLIVTSLALLGSACGGNPSDPVPQVTAATTDGDCVVRLHGKGGAGADAADGGAWIDVYPEGNGKGWGGKEWSYASEAGYRDAVDSIVGAADSAECHRIVVNGFSNGASMAAKLACAGENLNGRLIGVVADDPVHDTSTAECAIAAGVDVAVYWTGALDPPSAGTDCGSIDWTCDTEDVLVGIDAFAAGIGVDWQPSVHEEHAWYWDAPEIERWLS